MSSSKKDWKKYFKRKLRQHKRDFNFDTKNINDIIDFGERNYKYDGKRWKKHEENGDDNNESEMQLDISDDYETNDADSFASAKAVYELNKKLDNNLYTKAEVEAKIISLSPPTDISGKVDKVSNKALSTNDFTNTFKTKLNGISTSANNYSLPSSVVHSSELSSSATSTSTTTAANLKAVKTAYDKGNHSHPYAASSHSHSGYAASNHTHTDLQVSGEVSAVANSLAQRDGSGNLTANQFNGRATSANWADLGERYEADAQYDEGTVLAIGGDKEVTEFKAGMPLAGVISTNPGFKLNDTDDTKDWPFVCLKGRIPVKVKGNTNKGDFILADDNGKAISVNSINTIEEQNRLIGIALESGNDVIEVKV